MGKPNKKTKCHGYKITVSARQSRISSRRYGVISRKESFESLGITWFVDIL